MYSNEDNSNTSTPGLNQGINKNIDTLSTTSTTTTSITTAISSSNSAIPSDFIVNHPSTSTNNNKNTPRSNPAGSIKDLDNLNEHQLKELLDEAFSYKNPKDRENKSETFRQMLENVEQEKDRIPSKHGGSLQDLVEAQAVHNDLILDYEYTYNNRNRRHHHNSRPKKYCSLVSARQREGGSLPSNVNVSNCNLAVYEPSFLNEVLNKRRIGGGAGGSNISGGNKSERAVSVTSCNSATSGNSSIGGVGNMHDLAGGKDYDLTSNSGSLSGNNSADTIIDMGENYSDEKHNLSIDSSKKGYPSSMEDDCIEIGIQLNNGNKKFTPRAPGFNAAHQGKLEHTAPEPRHYVDEPITFAALERGKTIVDSTCLPLNENYTSCKSLMGEKSELVKPLYTSTKNITKQCDENGNSLNSTFNNATSSSNSQAKAKKKKSQSDRNTKIYNVTSVPGYRGKDPVDVLVKYIENTEDDKNKDNTKTQKLNENKRKDKKKDKENNNNNNNNNNKKFKKSNSLEELRSCTKLDEDEKQEIVGNVTMRNKNKQNKYNNNNNNNNNTGGIGSNVCSSTSSNSSTQSNSNETKENFKQNQQQINHNKRGERRSWGTEELTYLGENNAIEEVREKAKDKEKKKTKEQQLNTNSITANTTNTIDVSSLTLQQNDKMNKKKQDPISLSRISIDSLQCESAAEFHVVTKKKKSKKRQTNSDIVTNEFNNRNNSTGGLSSGGYGNNNSKYKDCGGNSGFGNQNKRYQITGNFTNDRDIYLHSFNTNKDKKSRRKSTSSMPPSEKSDSSDIESVHSLPIESTTSSSSITRNNTNNNNQSAHATKSYADMARSNAAAAAAAAAAEAAANSALGDKLDKWPTVSGGNDSSSSSIGNGNNSGNIAGGGGNGNIKNMSNKKSSVTNKDFPELLLSDKLNNNDLVNSGGITNKSITYSQSLSTNDDRKINQSSSAVPLIINEKSNNSTGIKSPTLKPSTVTVASMTDGALRSNEIKISSTIGNNLTGGGGGNKQILQKSKSVETDNYYNSMDQYPALEKTVKRYIQSSIVTTTTQPLLTAPQQQQQNIVNNTQVQGGVMPIISQQLQQQTIIGNFKQTPKTIVTNLPNTILPITPNSNLTIIQSQQQLLNDNKSKLIIINPSITTDLNATNLNNVVLAGNTITSATSSLNNLSHNITNNNNNTNINIGKKSITKQQLNNNNQLSNAKVIDNISSHHLESSSSSLSPTTTIIQQSNNDQLIKNSNIDNNNVININNQFINNRKISKNVSTVTTNILDGQTASTTTSTGINNNNNSTNYRKYKRGDKNQQSQQQNLNKNQEKHYDSLLSSSSSSTTTNHKNQQQQQQNLSSRPAVIILNDDSYNLTISSEFTFGDFKEEELRFYNSDNNNNNNEHISDSSGGNNIQCGTTINKYGSGNNITGGIYNNSSATNLSQSTNNDNNLDDSGAQFSFGSIGNIDTAINCNISMNSTDIIHDNEHEHQNEQQQHNLSSPNSDFGYSSLSINNRSILSNDNSIDISNKLSSTAHDIENNNSSIQDIDDSMRTTNLKLGINSNNNTISNNIINNYRDNNDDDITTKSPSLLNNCNQQGIKQSTTCSPIKQSSLENTENSSTSSSTILSNTLLLSSSSSIDPSSSSVLDSNKNIMSTNEIIDKTNNSATNTAITSTTGQLPNSNRNINSNNNININTNNSENQRRCIKEVNIRYIAPSQELNSMNFDKIVDFVGLAWEEIAHGNRGTQFYNGQ